MAGLMEYQEFNEFEALEMLEEIIKAYEVMHNLNLLHGDLRLEKILLSPSNKPLINDLGFAKKISYFDTQPPP